MTGPKLSVVIHAEEEFEWSKGFFRSNTRVSHGKALIDFIEEMLQIGAKVTLAMDYAFVDSEDGLLVIEHFKTRKGQTIEFATHLHPWVNPPFVGDTDEVPAHDSFPGNLPRQSEYAKLKLLTEKIEIIAGSRPTTYLAGRYGIGANTGSILRQLGYTVDLSVSAYMDFSKDDGPDFSGYTNRVFEKDKVTYIPHTSSFLALLKGIENRLNTRENLMLPKHGTALSSLKSRLLRVRKCRLSPEGFNLNHMKAVTKSQLRVGQEEFIFSFHSPSVQAGGTPYVKTRGELSEFKRNTFEYLKWFSSLNNSAFFLPAEYGKASLAKIS